MTEQPGSIFSNKKELKPIHQSRLLTCAKNAIKSKHNIFSQKTPTFIIGNHRFLTYYPGEGHTKDNIVIWFDDEKVLYGGCLVKSTETNDLGYLEDANLSEWPTTIKNVIKRFPKPQYVIPGHFGWTDNKGLEHTLYLLEEHEKKNTH